MWVEALKEFNKGKSEWCIPRKGSNEHKEVIKIMENMKSKTKTKPKTKTKTKTNDNNEVPFVIDDDKKLILKGFADDQKLRFNKSIISKKNYGRIADIGPGIALNIENIIKYHYDKNNKEKQKYVSKLNKLLEYVNKKDKNDINKILKHYLTSSIYRIKLNYKNNKKGVFTTGGIRNKNMRSFTFYGQTHIDNLINDIYQSKNTKDKNKAIKILKDELKKMNINKMGYDDIMDIIKNF